MDKPQPIDDIVIEQNMTHPSIMQVYYAPHLPHDVVFFIRSALEQHGKVFPDRLSSMGSDTFICSALYRPADVVSYIKGLVKQELGKGDHSE